MEPYFIFKNKSSKDMGIFIDKLPSIIKPAKNIEKIEVAGRNGFMTQDYNTYKSVIKSVECTILDLKNIDNICSWLSGCGDLIFSNEDDKIYKATIINQIPFSQIILHYYKFVIQFECQPFKYKKNEIEIDKMIFNSVDRNSIVINPLSSLNYVGGNTVQPNDLVKINEKDNEVEFYNIGNIESKPIITIWGSGSITLNVNGELITIDNVSGQVVINSEIMECYKENILFNNYMTGDFPVLKTGLNKITWSGNLERIKIKPNWRCL